MAKAKSRGETKRATRQALLQAGLAEIVERGLDAPSLDSICARAGFTRGAFYVHFENRDDFLEQLMEWVFGGFLDTIVAADSGEASLQVVVERFVDALKRGDLPLRQLGLRFPQMLEAIQRLPQVRERFKTLNREAIERVSKRVLDGQQRGTTRTDVDAESFATFLVAAAIGGMALHDAGVTLDLARVAEAILQVVES